MNIDDVHAEILLLRKRLHAVSNFLTSQEGRILSIDDNTQDMKEGLQDAEKSIKRLESQISKLNAQSSILKWLAACFSSVFLLIIAEQIHIIMSS